VNACNWTTSHIFRRFQEEFQPYAGIKRSEKRTVEQDDLLSAHPIMADLRIKLLAKLVAHGPRYDKVAPEELYTEARYTLQKFRLQAVEHLRECNRKAKSPAIPGPKSGKAGGGKKAKKRFMIEGTKIATVSRKGRPMIVWRRSGEEEPERSAHELNSSKRVKITTQTTDIEQVTPDIITRSSTQPATLPQIVRESPMLLKAEAVTSTPPDQRAQGEPASAAPAAKKRFVIAGGAKPQATVS
jgi:hypothetical protein